MSIFTHLKHLSVKDFDRTGKILHSPILCVSVNAVGSRVINTRLDRSIRIWKFSSMALTDPVIIDNAHSNPVQSIAWLPTTETTFASAGGDLVVKIWRGNGSLERDVSVGGPGLGLKFTIVLFLPDGTLMLSATTNGLIYVYDVLDNYSEITHISITTHSGDIVNIQWTNRGHACFFVGLSTGPILIYTYDQGRLSKLHSLVGCRSVTCILVDPQGRYIAAGSKEGVVTFWSTADMVHSRALTSIDQEISSLSANKDGTFIFVGYGAGSNCRIFDTDSLTECCEIPTSAAGAESKLAVAWLASRNVLLYSQDLGRALGYARKEDRIEDDPQRKISHGYLKYGPRLALRN
ncbi:WD40 repeat-like protein [Metschnikowia bicuspidata var. bicuspidata NRRL YB-4993]|uniref:WD40 repeat-like protein n=1 Tax=Metschnikowia bicuspidata var. bicuspidata NRRL YB-4993 TaxID=869754 RepID=A0A1A0HJ09_9ASCO|nr:WD40 repeat-like protein [Metschnikowia bicuspidata var. bicuspidata NRRL YB-4993]OBA24000.1 WD40 repeat-like protein [Metschnikowia bicuspidata var. bicuspidata NRRL YB-4993]